MLLAFDGKSVVQLSTFLELINERLPNMFSFSTADECLGIADYDQNVASSRDQDVQALWGYHETDVSLAVAPGKRGDDDVTFLALIIV